MEEFIGQKVKMDYIQEIGWRRPIGFSFKKKKYKVVKIISRREEHTREKYWRDRKHRVWYEVLLDDNNRYLLYWDRSAYGKGKDWILSRRIIPQ